VDVLLGSGSFSKKIRSFMVNKVPLTLIIGSQEMENASVTYRRLGSRDSTTLLVKEFMELLSKEIKDRTFPHFEAVHPNPRSKPS